MPNSKVRFGVRLIDDLGDSRKLVALAQQAEKLNFDTVLFPHDMYRLNSWALHAAVAATTEKIELHVRTNMYTQHPCEIAAYVSTMDQLAPGRIAVTVGLHNFDTITWVGIQPGDWKQRVRETADTLRRLLAGEIVKYDGEIYKNWTEKSYLRCKPVSAKIPIMICPVGEEFLELSGEIGDGTLPMVTPPESAKVIMEPVLRGLKKSKDPNRKFDKCAFVWLAVSDDRNEARDMLADITAYFGTYLDPRALATIGLTIKDYQPAYEAAMRQDHAAARAALTPQHLKTGIYGTPEDCVKQLQVIIDAGFDHISIGGPIGAKPAEAMKLISERVLPAFK